MVEHWSPKPQVVGSNPISPANLKTGMIMSNNKQDGRLRRISKFGSATVEELKKCSWPNRTELFESAVVVLASCFILAAFVWCADSIFQALIRSLIS